MTVLFPARVGGHESRYTRSRIPPFANNAKGPRIFYYAAPAMSVSAALYKESRMNFLDPTKPYRKSGGMGHPGICCTFCR